MWTFLTFVTASNRGIFRTRRIKMMFIQFLMSDVPHKGVMMLMTVQNSWNASILFYILPPSRKNIRFLIGIFRNFNFAETSARGTNTFLFCWQIRQAILCCVIIKKMTYLYRCNAFLKYSACKKEKKNTRLSCSFSATYKQD